MVVRIITSPASLNVLASKWISIGAKHEGFITTQLPLASAGTACHKIECRGEAHEVIIPTTPSGYLDA